MLVTLALWLFHNLAITQQDFHLFSRERYIEKEIIKPNAIMSMYCYVEHDNDNTKNDEHALIYCQLKGKTFIDANGIFWRFMCRVFLFLFTQSKVNLFFFWFKIQQTQWNWIKKVIKYIFNFINLPLKMWTNVLDETALFVTQL